MAPFHNPPLIPFSPVPFNNTHYEEEGRPGVETGLPVVIAIPTGSRQNCAQGRTYCDTHGSAHPNIGHGSPDPNANGRPYGNPYAHTHHSAFESFR